jgi:hypothetical protein
VGDEKCVHSFSCKGHLARRRRRQQHNIKIDVKVIVCDIVDCI